MEAMTSDWRFNWIECIEKENRCHEKACICGSRTAFIDFFFIGDDVEENCVVGNDQGLKSNVVVT